MADLLASYRNMTVSLPTFRKEGRCFIHVPDTATVTKAVSLLSKHSSTITHLCEKLGFQKDETLIAWLLEQMELSPDLETAIYKLLGV